jgi:hypothetical protein
MLHMLLTLLRHKTAAPCSANLMQLLAVHSESTSCNLKSTYKALVLLMLSCATHTCVICLLSWLPRRMVILSL